jgi:hypothetical protein
MGSGVTTEITFGFMSGSVGLRDDRGNEVHRVERTGEAWNVPCFSGSFHLASVYEHLRASVEK